MKQPDDEKNPFDHTVITSIEKIPDEDADQRAYILFLSGPLQGKLFCLDSGETVAGRGETADIVINDSRISRRHFRMVVEEGKAIIEDLGSTNGTYVNGRRVSRHSLENGDKIQVSSSTIIKFAYGDKGERMFHDEFYQMANFDAVTNVYNKRFFQERINEEFSHARRTNTPLTLLMIDIDFFKKINDTHGHLAGDFVLAHVAQKVKTLIRAEDIIARYGGEEFALILRGISEEGGSNTAERIRGVIQEITTEVDGKQLGVTVSIGIATLDGENFASPRDLIARADEFLYASKQRGRNCVTSERFRSPGKQL